MAMVIKDIRLERKESDILVRESDSLQYFIIPIPTGKINMVVAELRMLCLPYRVVPPWLILTVVGKQIHDELIDLWQSHRLTGAAVYRHRDHGYVAEGVKLSEL